MPVPFLGICYGMGMINLASGGEVARAEQREYGPAELIIDNDADLFHGFAKKDLVRVWMSHGDKMTSVPKGWRCLPTAAIRPSLPLPIPAGGSSVCSFILKWRIRRAERKSSIILFFVSAVVSRPGRGALHRDFREEDPRTGWRRPGALCA